MYIYIVPTESNEWDTVLINSRRQKFIFGVNNPTKIQYINMKEFSTRFFFFSPPSQMAILGLTEQVPGLKVLPYQGDCN